MLEDEDRKKVVKIDRMFIDLGMDGKAVKKQVRIGDPVTYGVGLETFGDGMAVSRAFDDKMGAWIAAEVLRAVKKAGGAAGDYVAAGTVQEEIGLRGGTTSAYLVFITRVPRAIGEIRSEGGSYTFIPLRSEFFPERSGPVKHCLGVEIPFTGPKGHRNTIVFREWKSARDEINALMRSVRRD